uniref:Uncharacterized protein n=1 Tax=Cyprinus carpio TaxID=7962 RepID=A0A8C1KPQ6_CYPCA
MMKMFPALAFCCLCCSRLVGVFGDTVTVKSVSVLEGHSFTLHYDFNEMMSDDLILLRFEYENTLIVQIDVLGFITVYDDVLDGRFRDRVKVDHQTGSLNITNITTQHAGLYKLWSNTVSKIFSLTVYEVHVSCCDTVEAVMRLVVTALMGVAAAAAAVLLVSDVRSSRR